jgi:hypothetical protein
VTERRGRAGIVLHDGADGTPTRTCVGCGSRDRQSAMLRLRRDAAGTITSDASVRTGRSAYVHGSSECVRGLVRSKVLGKSLRHNVAKQERLDLVSALERNLAAGTLGPRTAVD